VLTGTNASLEGEALALKLDEPNLVRPGDLIRLAEPKLVSSGNLIRLSSAGKTVLLVVDVVPPGPGMLKEASIRKNSVVVIDDLPPAPSPPVLPERGSLGQIGVTLKAGDESVELKL